MSEPKEVNRTKIWKDWFSTNAFEVDKRQRKVFRILPHDPRCKFCNAPFEGIGGTVVRMMYGKQRSNLNPRFCNRCDLAAQKFPGGAEVDMAMLFADVRGSTALSESMQPADYTRLINLFYTRTTKHISEEDGLVEKLAGDAVGAFWGAGFAGGDYIRRTIAAAQKIAQEMLRMDIPVGIGVHAGVAYFGSVGSADGLTDISAIGEEVNLAARIASKAAAGEIIVSEAALEKAGMKGEEFEARNLELKGIGDVVRARVMRASG